MTTKPADTQRDRPGDGTGHEQHDPEDEDERGHDGTPAVTTSQVGAAHGRGELRVFGVQRAFHLLE